MRWMRWSWDDLMSAPADLISLIVDEMVAESGRGGDASAVLEE